MARKLVSLNPGMAPTMKPEISPTASQISTRGWNRIERALSSMSALRINSMELTYNSQLVKGRLSLGTGI